MIPRSRLRTPATHAARSDPHQRRLESLAAEFALLAQRRARTVHQVEMLDQQREAAAEALRRVQARIAWLSQRMDALDPALRDPDAFAPTVPEPPPAAPPIRPTKPLARPLAAKLVAGKAGPMGKGLAGHRWLAARPTPRPPVAAGR